MALVKLKCSQRSIIKRHINHVGGVLGRTVATDTLKLQLVVFQVQKRAHRWAIRVDCKFHHHTLTWNETCIMLFIRIFCISQFYERISCFFTRELRMTHSRLILFLIKGDNWNLNNSACIINIRYVPHVHTFCIGLVYMHDIELWRAAGYKCYYN